MKIKSLIDKVRAILDEEELSAMGVDIQDDNSINIDERIKKFIDPSIDEINKVISPRWLKTVTLDLTQYPNFRNEDGSGYLNLPKDFLRLAAFKMAMWQRTVFKPINAFTPEYEAQKYFATRGGVRKPIVAIVVNPTPKENECNLRLEYYSLPPHFLKHDVEFCTYVPYSNTDTTGDDIDIAKEMENLLCWFVARDTALSFTSLEKVKGIEKRIEEELKLFM